MDWALISCVLAFVVLYILLALAAWRPSSL